MTGGAVPARSLLPYEPKGEQKGLEQAACDMQATRMCLTLLAGASAGAAAGVRRWRASALHAGAICPNLPAPAAVHRNTTALTGKMSFRNSSGALMYTISSTARVAYQGNQGWRGWGGFGVGQTGADMAAR